MNNVISGIMPDDARILIDAMEAGRHKKTLLVTAVDSSLPGMAFRHVIGTDVVYMGEELFRHLQQDIALGKAKKFDVQRH